MILTPSYRCCVCAGDSVVSRHPPDLAYPPQLLQDELTREECEGDPSEQTPAVNTDSNSCSSSATNYTDSGAECDKVRRSQLQRSRLQLQMIPGVCCVLGCVVF